MARSTKKRANNKGSNDSDLDEVDQFHADQEKILLDAGRGANAADDEFEFSDEEVLDNEGSESEEEEEEDYYGLNEQEDDQKDAEEGWGAAKSSYYGADEIEDEEAAREEEAEALRLQKKHISELKIQDFYDEDDVEEWNKSANAAENTGATKRVVSHQDPSALPKEERLLILQSSYPEVGPLISELHELEPKLKLLKKNSTKSRTDQIKFAALSSYISTIYAYFALFVGKIENGRVNLKSHSVMKGILKARELWRIAQELTEIPEEKGSETDQVSNEIDNESVEESDLEIDEDDSEDSDISEEEVRSQKRVKIMDEADEFELSRPKITRKGSKKAEKDSDKQQMDEDEKEERKRTLRFYTSKIDQRDNRLSRTNYGGDDDLPYKEREYERRKRLLEEARLRGLKGKKDEADDFGSDDEPTKQDDEDDYYMQAKAAAKAKKSARKQAHLDAVEAAKEGRLAELDETVADGQKRAINYQILKNKGLTPKRSKDNRNPRVKKRKKYNEAQKKLSSVRAVYKTPTSAYGGESTGIKKNAVRSVHFKS